MPWQSEAKKDVLICEKRRWADKKRLIGDIRMGKPNYKVIVRWINSCAKRTGENWNILVPRGKEIKRDSLSSGERNGRSPRTNLIETFRRMILEKTVIEGDNPVSKKSWYLVQRVRRDTYILSEDGGTILQG